MTKFHLMYFYIKISCLSTNHWQSVAKMWNYLIRWHMIPHTSLQHSTWFLQKLFAKPKLQRNKAACSCFTRTAFVGKIPCNNDHNYLHVGNKYKSDQYYSCKLLLKLEVQKETWRLRHVISRKYSASLGFTASLWFSSENSINWQTSLTFKFRGWNFYKQNL